MIKQGHVLDVLKAMPDDSVQCVITSPPYYGLRSYGTEPQVWGNHNGCSHEWGCELSKKQLRGSLTNINNSKEVFNKALADIHLSTGNFCLSCNAWRGELGLEPSFDCQRDRSNEIEIREDLTAEEREELIRELLALGLIR